MSVLSPVDQQLISEALERGGARVRFNDLVDEVGMSYRHTLRRAHYLERLGCMCLERSGGRGRPLNICCVCLLTDACKDTP